MARDIVRLHFRQGGIADMTGGKGREGGAFVELVPGGTAYIFIGPRFYRRRLFRWWRRRRGLCRRWRCRSRSWVCGLGVPPTGGKEGKWGPLGEDTG